MAKIVGKCRHCNREVNVDELYNSANEFVVYGYECQVCGHAETSEDS